MRPLCPVAKKAGPRAVLPVKGLVASRCQQRELQAARHTTLLPATILLTFRAGLNPVSKVLCPAGTAIGRLGTSD